MTRVRLIVHATFLSALFAGTASADHSFYPPDLPGPPYHWPVNRPFTIQVGNNLSIDWTAGFLVDACTNWSVTSGACNNPNNPVRLDPVAGSAGDRRLCPTVDGTVQVCSWPYGENTGWNGIATLVANGPHITAGRVLMNDSKLGPGGSNYTEAWRRMVLAQEIGHCLGLDHQDEDEENADLLDSCGRGSCMDYSDNPTNQGTPNQHDYDQLVAIYNHKHSPLPPTAGANTSSRPGPVADGIDPESPATWGSPVGFLKGRANLFRKDLGNGQWAVTRVLWDE